jgi:RHS repeat-associated protein
VLGTYTYGDTTERLIAEEGGQRTYYACNGNAEYVETGGSTSPVWSKTYVYLAARLLATTSPNGSGGENIQYHHPDRLGTRIVTNAQNTTFFEQQALPYGTALNESAPTGGATGGTNRRFTTYDRSAATGLDYAINRHYDPQQGRFTQVDPAGMSAASLTNPQSLNLYAYCANDPINHVDPSGLGFLSWLKKIFKRVVHALIHAVITAVFTFIQTLIMTGSVHAALVAAIGAGVADFLKELGWPSQGYWKAIPGGTPQWNPNSIPILGGGPSGLSRYIIYNFTSAGGLLNPTCIASAVAGGVLGEARRLIEGLRNVNGKPVATGLPAHDGIHVYAPAGQVAKVTAIQGMGGKILHTGRQSANKKRADYKLGVMDIELTDPINGETYVMTLKDLNYNSMRLSGNVKPGQVLGTVTGSADMRGESGLHVTLMPKSVYDEVLGTAPTGPKRNQVPFGSLMDAARDQNSPFRCTTVK